MPLYTPPQFREDRPEVLAGAIRAIQFATLVTAGPGGLQVSHVPMALNGDTLDSHVARPNPHAALDGLPTVAIFQGPHAYVSPAFYPAKREHGRVVPTWNYIVVHVHGVLERVDDPAWLRAQLAALTDANERSRAEPWAMSDAPADYLDGMVRAITGLRLRVSRLEGKWKLSQNRAKADRVGTIDGLQDDPAGAAVASAMRALEPAE